MTRWRNALLTGAVFAVLASSALAWGHESLSIHAEPSTVAAERIGLEEGFQELPYRDGDGLAIGYGTDLPITREEAFILLRWRLNEKLVELARRWPTYWRMPMRVKVALADMAYQLGVGGLLEFRDMMTALERRDYAAARQAALNSEWARETPDRAHRVAAMLRE